MCSRADKVLMALPAVVHIKYVQNSKVKTVDVQELIEDIGDVDDKNALTAAAFFHAKFENIHPFADGNGRTGRLVMNYLLVIHNHPPIVIHQEDRKAYFDALEAWDEEQNLQPLKDFLRAQTVKTWEKQVLRRRR